MLYSSETNLKVKQALQVTGEMENDLNQLSAFDGKLAYRFARPNFYQYRNGSIKYFYSYSEFYIIKKNNNNIQVDIY